MCGSGEDETARWPRRSSSTCIISVPLLPTLSRSRLSRSRRRKADSPSRIENGESTPEVTSSSNQPLFVVFPLFALLFPFSCEFYLNSNLEIRIRRYFFLFFYENPFPTEPTVESTGNDNNNKNENENDINDQNNNNNSNNNNNNSNKDTGLLLRLS